MKPTERKAHPPFPDLQGPTLPGVNPVGVGGGVRVRNPLVKTCGYSLSGPFGAIILAPRVKPTAKFLESAALELGEDPRQFQRILKGLIEARHPVGTLELAVIEDIALLLLKKSRLGKAELAVQVSNLHQHDFQRRKQMLPVGDNDSDTTEFDAREDGLRRHLDCPGRYGQSLELLGRILGLINLDEFGYRMQEAMRVLYGGAHTLRGAALDNFRRQLSELKPQDENYEPETGHDEVAGERDPGGGAALRVVPAGARDQHALGAGGGHGALARAVDGDHPAAELAAPADGT